jgi:intein/homing endonuclease
MNFDINKLKSSKELALFLGMLAGDGCLPINHNGGGYRIYPICFYNTNKQYVELFSDLFSRLFGLDGKIRGRKRKNKLILWEFQKYSVELYQIINKDFEIHCGKKALNVKIPSFILKGSDELKKQFFFGLLITDGGIRKTGSIIFHSASKQLIQDLQGLINDVWVINKPIKSYLQREKFRSYQLNLNKKESSIILSQLPPWHNPVLR